MIVKQKVIAFIAIILLLGSCGNNKTITLVSDLSGLEEITLGGVKQSILIESKDFTKPILLVLHGGPGFAMMPLFHTKNNELENHFIVINWDQRGAGKSYIDNAPIENMTLSQFVSDAHELTQYLKQKYNRKKIFIVGHSFGTILGMLLSQIYPQDYFAFAGVGQVVDIIANEQYSYNYALDMAKINKNTIAINELKNVGYPNDDGKYLDDLGYDITMKWMSYYGGELYGKRDSEDIENILLNSTIYANNKSQLINGWEFSQLLFNDENLWYLDFRKSITKVNIPIYFLTGHHDYDTPFPLVEEYFNILNAPSKELIWFEDSSHFPFYEEPEKFNKIIIEKFSYHTK